MNVRQSTAVPGGLEESRKFGKVGCKVAFREKRSCGLATFTLKQFNLRHIYRELGKSVKEELKPNILIQSKKQNIKLNFI